ncbi:MAG TPA: hypothetical protein VGM72_08650 [Micropepsaceae bacterium]|jgi:hypothetical protein
MRIAASRGWRSGIALLALVWTCDAAQGATSATPDFSGFWQHGVPGQQYDKPPSGPGPVRRIGVPENYAANLNWHGDDSNPILQPWAADAVRKEWARESQGLPELSAQTTCRPAGVPFILSFLRPMQILQTPKKVVFLYQFDHQSRVVYLDQPHTPKLAPSYYGESVGHYEDGALIVDTIGLNDKTWTDRFATPHTEQLHVIERYRLIDEGKTLEVFFTVEDPGAFTTKWSAITRYPRVNVARIEEEACAENNAGYGITVPVADFDPISGQALHDPR